MAINTTYQIDLFDDILSNIQAQYDTVNDPAESPYGAFARKHEVLQVLTEKDKSGIYKYKKYPLIILYHGQTENKGQDVGTEYIFSPLMSIVTNSSRTKKTADRYSDVVKPILFPIYKLLLQEIAGNPAIYQSFEDEIPHTIKVWDGSPNSNGLLFNDYLDGIDIQFSDLRVKRYIPDCV